MSRPTDALSRVTWFREKANECRKASATATIASVRRGYDDLASTYERLAVQTERLNQIIQESDRAPH